MLVTKGNAKKTTIVYILLYNTNMYDRKIGGSKGFFDRWHIMDLKKASVCLIYVYLEILDENTNFNQIHIIQLKQVNATREQV